MLPFSLIELWGTVLSITVPTIHFEAQNWMSLQKDWLIVFASVEIDTNYCGEGGGGQECCNFRGEILDVSQVIIE